ncbi:hypothetical protein OpiT1DRAFT_05261 [Opitutaceae bacterium TAV1]|nr:hypothetical protein OpiT1DRAFT_05261 [Opitutaceae bacterium TAV1]
MGEPETKRLRRFAVKALFSPDSPPIPIPLPRLRLSFSFASLPRAGIPLRERQTTNGLQARSLPIVVSGPCPGATTASGGSAASTRARWAFSRFVQK